MTTKFPIIILTTWNQKIQTKSSLSNVFDAENSNTRINDVLQKTPFANFVIKNIIKNRFTSLKNIKSKKK